MNQNIENQFKEKFGMSLEEWRNKTIIKNKELKIKLIKERIEEIEYLDDHPSKTRMLKIWNTKLKNEINNQ